MDLGAHRDPYVSTSTVCEMIASEKAILEQLLEIPRNLITIQSARKRE